MSGGMPVLRNNDYVQGKHLFYLRQNDISQRQVKVCGDVEWYAVSFGTFEDLLDVLNDIDEELHTVEIMQHNILCRLDSETSIAMFVAICGMC